MGTSSHNKFILQELIFSIGYILCFIAALAFLIQRNFLYALIFVTLHGCLTLTYIFIRHGQRGEDDLTLFPEHFPAADDFNPEHFGNDNALVTQLRQEKDDLSYNNELLTRQLTDLTQQNETLTSLLREAELKTVEALDPSVAASILPPDEQVTEVDIISLSQQIVEDMQPLCSRAGIRLDLSTSSPSLFYPADPRYISLMIRNIIDNSIKYMQQNGNLVITISNAGSNLFVAFKDNGRGLPAEEMPNIFDLNFQGSNRISGNGLGLAQVKAIVEHYHGSIYAHSANGMGIYIQLPIHSQIG